MHVHALVVPLTTVAIRARGGWKHVRWQVDVRQAIALEARRMRRYRNFTDYLQRPSCLAQAAASVSPPTTTDAEALKARIVSDEAKYVLQTYARPEELVITHGEGSYVYDVTGKKYLDFAAGIAVNALGHSHPQWVAAVQEQAGKLMHTSNLFHTMPQVCATNGLPS
jgi:hypothetical protein